MSPTTRSTLGRWLTPASLVVVAAGVSSVLIRTRLGEGSADIDVENTTILLILASPSLLLVPLTRSWRVGPWIALLAMAGWLPMLTSAGDTSCTDCAFVLVIPFYAGLVQVFVFVVALLAPSLRRPTEPADHP